VSKRIGILSRPTAAVPTTPPAAQTLPPHTCQQLALDALAGASITDWANHHHVSQKLVSQQTDKAQQALDDAFDPPTTPTLTLRPMPSWTQSFFDCRSTTIVLRSRALPLLLLLVLERRPFRLAFFDKPTTRRTSYPSKSSPNRQNKTP
jgi:hypothetical protein